MPPKSVRRLQWLYSHMVPNNSSVELDYPMTFTWRGESFPYTVPDGHWLGITDLVLSSKGGSENRASYFVIDNVIACPDNFPLSFRIPIAVPPGTILRAQLINNEIGGVTPDKMDQWMTALMTGCLIETDETDYTKLAWPT